MADMEQTGGSEGQENTEIPDANGQGANTGDNSSAGSDAGTGEEGSQEGQEDGDEVSFIKDDAGKEFISREAFEKRIATLTKQKHEGGEARALLESIRTDPLIQKEFIKSLNLEEQRASSPNEANEPNSFEKFIAPLPPEYQAHYRGFMESISPIFESFVKSEMDKAIKPIMSWIGESRVKSFASENKDYAKYEPKIAEIMSSGRAKTLEDAYKIASYETRLKSVSQAGAKAEASRQDKLNRTPFAGKGQPTLRTQGKKPDSLKESLQKAAEQIGWGG